MPLDPVAINDNPWVKILRALQTKIGDVTLSFSKFCVTNFGVAPRIFARTSTANNAAYWDPPLTECPSVLITAINTPPFEDHGVGNEHSFLAFEISLKYELRDRNQEIALAANYEFCRTLFYGARVGSGIDPLSNVLGVGRYHMEGDLTPELALAGAQTTAKTRIALRFTLTHKFLG